MRNYYLLYIHIYIYVLKQGYIKRGMYTIVGPYFLRVDDVPVNPINPKPMIIATARLSDSPLKLESVR